MPGDELLDGMIELCGPELLGVWPLHGPQLVTDAGAFDSPDDFSASPPWTSTYLTWLDAHTCRETADNNSHSVLQSLAGLVAVGPCQWTIDVAGDGRNFARIYVWDGSGAHYFHIDFTTGGTSEILGCTPQVTSLGGGIWRCGFATSIVNPASAYARVWASANGVDVYYTGDVTKGIKLYNATITQTSIVTAPNDPILAARNLSLYGDRFDWTYDTKASEPVLAPDWAGLDCAVFSGATLLRCDPMAARYSGVNKDAAIFIASDVPAAPNSGIAFSVANSGATIPLWFMQPNSSGNMTLFRRKEPSGYVSDAVAAVPGRSILAARYDGTTKKQSVYRNGTLVIPESAENDGNMPVDTCTLGIRDQNGSLSLPWTGTMRMVVAAMRTTPAQVAAVSRLMQAYCPVS
jgi:hypothetical protein